MKCRRPQYDGWCGDVGIIISTSTTLKSSDIVVCVALTHTHTNTNSFAMYYCSAVMLQYTTQNHWASFSNNLSFFFPQRRRAKWRRGRTFCHCDSVHTIFIRWKFTNILCIVLCWRHSNASGVSVNRVRLIDVNWVIWSCCILLHFAVTHIQLQFQSISS